MSLLLPLIISLFMFSFEILGFKQQKPILADLSRKRTYWKHLKQLRESAGRLENGMGLRSQRQGSTCTSTRQAPVESLLSPVGHR